MLLRTCCIHGGRPAGDSRMTSAEWLAVRAEGDVINGSVREKEEKIFMLMCYGNGGFTWSSKSSETGQNRQWRHLQRMFRQSDDSLNAGVRAGEDAPGVKSEVSCRLHTVCHCVIRAVQFAPGTAQSS